MGEDPPNPLLTPGAKYALEWGEDPPNPPLNAAELFTKQARTSHFNLETTRQPPKPGEPLPHVPEYDPSHQQQFCGDWLWQ